MYFCRGAGGSEDKSDRDLIHKWMRAIPEKYKYDVSVKYETLYNNGKDSGRGKANIFLQGVAKKFAKESCDQSVVNGCYGQIESGDYELGRPLDEVKKPIETKVATASGTKPVREGGKRIIRDFG